MKDIFEILSAFGVEVDEAKHKDIRRAVAENYKTVNEFNDKISGLNTQLATANSTISDLKDKLEDASKVDVKALQDQIKAFEDDKASREQKEAAARELEALKARFSPLKGDKTFINEGTESWIFGEFKNALGLEENQGKSDAEIYEAVTRDKNIYENPNKIFKNPPASVQGTPKSDKAYMDAFYADNPFYKK